MKGDRIWGGVALALGVAAVAASLHTALSARRVQDQLARLQQDVQQVEAYAHRWAGEEAYRAGLEGAGATQPVELESAVVSSLGEGVAQIKPLPTVAIGNGWQRREATIDIASAPYSEVALLLSALTRQQPPWRLTELGIRPSATAGKGGIQLTVQAVEKRQ